jgi:deoxyadenosine/deoxycytidine kinase
VVDNPWTILPSWNAGRFNLQICFLNSRFRQEYFRIRESGKIIQDRTNIYEDAHFAPNLLFYGINDQYRDFENYSHF